LGKVGVRSVGPFEKVYPPEFDFFDHLRGNYTPGIGVAFPRGVFHDLNMKFDEDLTTAEDWDYIMRAATITGVASSPKITSVYHWWVNEHSSRTDHPTHEWASNYQRILQKMDENLVLFPKGTPYAIRSLLEERDKLRAQLAHQDQLHREATSPWTGQHLNGDGPHLSAAEVDHKRWKLNNLLSSKSWRLSAPVRVMGLIKGERYFSIADCHQLASSQLDEAIGQVYASSSWKLTAPFRKVDEGLRRVVKHVFRL
jgi:hypothetical protein